MNQVRKGVKIGRPGYRITKQFDHESMQRSLLFQARSLVPRSPICPLAARPFFLTILAGRRNEQVDFPEIEVGTKPRHRVMSAFEQKVYG